MNLTSVVLTLNTLLHLAEYVIFWLISGSLSKVPDII